MELSFEGFDHIHIQDLKERLMENESNIHELLTMLMDYIPQIPTQWKTVIEERNLQKLNHFGHKLKGIAISSSLPRLSEIGKALQHMEKWDPIQIQFYEMELQKEVEELIPILKKLLNDFPNSLHRNI